jgi:hypothetical protein
MSVLDNFVEEMLQQAVPKQALIERWIHGLDNEKPPQFRYQSKNIRSNPICMVSYMIINGIR